MRIPDGTLSEIQNRLDIAEVIGEYVHLQKKGNRYWGCCPFHQEKTPSFSVTPDKGVFYCFGCHKGGGLYQFVMEVEKVAFPDAVEMLARKAGVELVRENEEKGGVNRETFLELNRRVAKSFHWILVEGKEAAAARAYLARRGVSAEMIEQFQIGYAPAAREWLGRFLVQKSYSPDFLARTGLFSEASKGRSALFSDRIMFPIANPRGEVVAFGGRALTEGVPKYLNSPETPFFRKSENLFAIEKAVSAIREGGSFFLVEGYMDVIAMHQAGLTACVAPLGTALTEQQIRLLKRYASRAVLVFDGDEAGEKATMRAIEMLEKQDMAVSVVEIPDGQDPADIVQRIGPAAIRERAGAARPCFPYLVDKAMRRFNGATPDGKEGIRDFLFPFVAAPGSRVRADEYLRGLAEAIRSDEAAVRADFSRWAKGVRAPRQQRPAGVPEVSADLFLMLVVAARQELFPMVRNSGIAMGDLEDPWARGLFVALEEAYRAENPSFDGLCARIEDAALKEMLIRKVSSGEFDLNQERMVSDGLKRIKQRALKRRIDALAAEMRRLETDTPNTPKVRELLAEKMHLDDELFKLGSARVPGDSHISLGARTQGT